jgi:hypothetical protein
MQTGEHDRAAHDRQQAWSLGEDEPGQKRGDDGRLRPGEQSYPMPYPVPDQSPTFPDVLPPTGPLLAPHRATIHRLRHSEQAYPPEGGDRPDAVQRVCHHKDLADASVVSDLSHLHGGFPGAPGGILGQDRRLRYTHLPQDSRHHDSLGGRMFALTAGRYEEISQAPNVQLARMPRPDLQRRTRPPSWQYLCPENHGDPGSGHHALRDRGRWPAYVYPQKLTQLPEDASPKRALHRRASRLASSRSPGELTFISRRSRSPNRRNSSPTYSTSSTPSRNPCTACVPPSSAVPRRGSSVLA